MKVILYKTYKKYFRSICDCRSQNLFNRQKQQESYCTSNETFQILDKTQIKLAYICILVKVCNIIIMKFHFIASVKPKNNLCVSESHTSSKSKTSLCIQYFLTIFILIFFVCLLHQCNWCQVYVCFECRTMIRRYML